MKYTWLIAFTLLSNSAHGGFSTDDAKHQAENRIRTLFEPLRSRYCQDECSTLGIDVNIKFSATDTFAPGFEDSSMSEPAKLVPDGATIRLLMDSKVGPVTRQNLLNLFQKHLDGALEFPVRIDLITAKFPMPLGSARKIGELRERVTKQFKDQLEKLFAQHCPDQCMLADFNVRVEPVNPEEAEYGSSNEIVQEGETAVMIQQVSASILMDELLAPEERTAIFEMAKLVTNYLKNVQLKASVIRFPHPDAYAEGGLGRSPSSRKGKGKGYGYSSEEKSLSKSESTLTNQTQTTDQKTSTQQNALNSTEQNQRQERFDRIETIERVEDGDAVQAELNTFKVYGLVFACSVLALLIFIAVSGGRVKTPSVIPAVQRVIQNLAADPLQDVPPAAASPVQTPGEASAKKGSPSIGLRFEVQALLDELQAIFAQFPKVAKLVFSRVLTEEGIEVTSQYVAMFGETVMLDLLRDHSLQADLTELMDFYAHHSVEATDEERLELLKSLHNRTVAAKMYVIGKRATTAFDFLVEMDHLQILELIKNESMTVKAIVLTQCDTQKRTSIFGLLDEASRLTLLTELSRIDHLPRNYIHNVAAALKRKQKENPRLNTEALPGSDVLVTLLEKSPLGVQQQILASLDQSNTDASRIVKTKLVSLETLPYLRDSHLLEIVMGLKNEELLHFLRGVPEHIRETIFAKSPRELILELQDQLNASPQLNREAYQSTERKVLNRIKVMANDGALNLLEINERMFQAAQSPGTESIENTRTGLTRNSQTNTKAAGW